MTTATLTTAALTFGQYTVKFAPESDDDESPWGIFDRDGDPREWFGDEAEAVATAREWAPTRPSRRPATRSAACSTTATTWPRSRRSWPC